MGAGEQSTVRSSKKSPKKGSFVVNLADMIKDFDIANRISLQQPINYDSSDCNTEFGSKKDLYESKKDLYESKKDP